MSESDPLLIQRYPFAVRILAAASQVDLDLERVPHPLLDDNELALIRVTTGGESHVVLVDNEYGDADSGHRALWLAQVLMAFEAHREDPSFDTWCREQFLNVAPRTRQTIPRRTGPGSGRIRRAVPKPQSAGRLLLVRQLRRRPSPPTHRQRRVLDERIVPASILSPISARRELGERIEAGTILSRGITAARALVRRV